MAARNPPSRKVFVFSVNDDGTLQHQSSDLRSRQRREMASEQEKMNYLNLMNFICCLKEPWRIVANCVDVSVCLEHLVSMNLKDSSCFDRYANDERKSVFIEALIDYVKYMYDYMKENIINIRHLLKCDEDFIRLQTLYKFTLVMWSLADISNDFCVKFLKLRGLKSIFKYISDQSLVSHIEGYFQLQNQLRYQQPVKQRHPAWTKTVVVNNDEKTYSLMIHLYKTLLGTIHDLNKLRSLFASQWFDSNAFESLLKFTTYSIVHMSDLRLLTCLSIINLHENKNARKPEVIPTSSKSENLASLINFENVLKDVIFLIGLSAKEFNNPTKVTRRRFLVDDDEYHELAIVQFQDTTWRLTELLKSLTLIIDHLDDKLKLALFNQNLFEIRNHLKLILFNGNEYEQEHVLALLLKLALDKETATSIRMDYTIYSFILGISLNETIQNRKLVKNADLIIFLMNNYKETSQVSSRVRIRVINTPAPDFEEGDEGVEIKINRV